MLDIIQHNPFRLIGVFSTATRKEIVANLARIKANIRVDRQISFQADLDGILPSPKRTAETIAEAESKLALPKDLIHYAQFWFIENTELDKIAINNLSVGSYDKAISIWEKKENLSSVHNRILTFLIRGNYAKAFELAFLFYGKYSFEFAQLILGKESNIVTSESLEHGFLDVLCDEIGASEVSLYIINKDWGEYVGSKIVKPLIDDIDRSITVAKETKGKGANIRLSAGTKLMSDTLTPLRSLKSELSISDPRYQIIADKLGLAILQCGIDYYNDSNDDDAAFKAMKLQKYAQSIVVGKMAKDRCDENVRILEDIISKLPPLEVMANHRAIQSSLATFAIQPDLIRCSIQLIKNCVPHLVQIKEKLGKTHQYYIKISTSIVNNALGNVIAEVNEAQNVDFNTLKNTLISAWRAQLYMDKFDLDPEYKEGRYKECREALHGIISNCKGFDDSGLSFMYQYGCGWCNDLDTSDVDLRTDEEYYQTCSNLTSYRSYLQRFPSGKYVTQAKSRIEELRFKQCKTVADYQKFISDYPNSKFIAKAKEVLNRFKKEEEERRARIERQERAISSCSTTDEIVSLYAREKSNSINIDKCSLRAFELAKCEEDYRKVLSIFGVRTSGGKKAKTSLDEIEKKRKEAAERRSKTIKWSLIIVIPLLVLLGVYLIWGLSGLSSTCYVFTFIFGLIAFGGIGSKEGEGCVIGIISGLIALGLGSLGGYLEDLSKEDKQQKTEYVSSYTNGSTNNSSGRDYLSSSTTDDTNDESYTVDNDYETYINNQLKTGSKPYKEYYRSRTGDNYLDFKTSGNDYVIIVKDYGSSDVVNHIYVRAGDTGRLYLPNGTFNIYFYGGKGWNPDMENGNVKGGFVSGGNIQKDGPVELYNQYGEYTLYPVQNGNLQLQGASKGEAF